MKSNVQEKSLSPETVAAIIARGYVASDEVEIVFGKGDNPTPRHTKLSVKIPGESISENIWVVNIAPDVYVFANHALSFYPNHSWGALCFTKNGRYDHARTEKNLKKCYAEYMAAFEKVTKTKKK